MKIKEEKYNQHDVHAAQGRALAVFHALLKAMFGMIRPSNPTGLKHENRNKENGEKENITASL